MLLAPISWLGFLLAYSGLPGAQARIGKYRVEMVEANGLKRRGNFKTKDSFGIHKCRA